MRGLVAATVGEILLLEVIRADPAQRMGGEFVQRHAVEVIAIAPQTARQAIAAAVGGVPTAALEGVPAVFDPRERITGCH